MTRDSPDRFNYQDAGLVADLDRDTFPHNIGSVGIFEGAIPFASTVAHVERRLELSCLDTDSVCFGCRSS